MNGTGQTRKSIVIFLVITMALSALFYILFASLPEHVGLINFGFMWCPGMAALLTRWIMKIKTPGTGWRPGPWRYWLLAYLLPLAYCLAAYGLIWLTGIAPFKKDAPLLPILTGILIASMMNNLSTLGEEIGWRGFLVPQLYRLNGFAPTAAISGVIWAFWHLPAMIILYFADGSVTAYNLVMLVITLVGLSFIFAWLRLKSNSVWPAVILHTSHATFIGYFDQLTAPSALSPYLSGDMGAVISMILVVLAVGFWRKSSQLPQREAYETVLAQGTGKPEARIAG